MLPTVRVRGVEVCAGGVSHSGPAQRQASLLWIPIAPSSHLPSSPFYPTSVSAPPPP